MMNVGWMRFSSQYVFKEEVDDIAAGVALLKGDVVRLGKRLRFFHQS